MGAPEFARLSEGQHPVTGEQMVQHRVARTYANDRGESVTIAEHRAGWDATFSAPKSVSITALVGGDELVRQAHRESVAVALNELERYVQARIGGNHPAETTGKMVAAKFEHDSARPVNSYAAPQLHAHVVIFNVSQTADGETHALQPHDLASIRAADLNTQHIHRYIDERQRRRASNTTNNRELQVLKRALTLALECDPPKITRAPYIRLLPENNVRTGFLDDKEYVKLRDELPEYLKPIFVVAYHLGNRLGELRYLRWAQLDFDRNQIRLNPAQTKNKKGSVLPIYGEMRQWLLMQKAIRDTKYPEYPYVFHHDGRSIVDFRKAWCSATKRAGLQGIVFHDLRRSVIRNMREAGIPENVAMAISGHKTRAVFERYNIVSDRDIKQAAEKMEHRLKESLKAIRQQEKSAFEKRLQ